MHTLLSRQLIDLGITPGPELRRNWVTARLYEAIAQEREGCLAADGPVIVRTGKHTGRAAKDKFTVEDDAAANVWWGEVNQPLPPERFEGLKRKLLAYFQECSRIYVLDGYAGADPAYRLRVRVITAHAWHNLFTRNLLIPERDPEVLRSFEPEFVILHAPQVHADPEVDGTRSETFVVLSFGARIAVIGGTAYAGEIKKTVFTVMNKLLPERGVLSMHCSANYGRSKDDVALFFGLSGTGKTTLSTDTERTLIGDDEHGWSDRGVFNIEGGCYAKVIRLSREGEPEIWDAAHRFGTVLENVVYDPETRVVNFADDSITENTRAGYPLEAIPTMDPDGIAGHPRHILFLTADAFGVLPPIAKLTPEQAMYHFLSGYTAKVAGTEMGVTEPTATFSACFGAPFLPLHPGVYAEMLGERIARHRPGLWLVNTGWTGGPYGVGERMALRYTRRMVRAALAGELDDAPTATDPVFGFEVPTQIDGVPDEILIPRNTWPDPAAYDAKAQELARMFIENFTKYADGVSEAVREAGPRI